MNHHSGWLGLLCLCWWALAATQAASQTATLPLQVLSSGGDVSQTDRPSLDWTLGQTSVATLYTGQRMLTQGFQQSHLRVIPLDVPTKTPPAAPSAISWSVSVFPNPTRSEVTVRTVADAGTLGYWQLLDATGRLVLSREVELTDYTGRIDLTAWPAGSYRLRVATVDESLVQHLQILKID